MFVHMKVIFFSNKPNARWLRRARTFFIPFFYWCGGSFVYIPRVHAAEADCAQVLFKKDSVSWNLALYKLGFRFHVSAWSVFIHSVRDGTVVMRSRILPQTELFQ